MMARVSAMKGWAVSSGARLRKQPLANLGMEGTDTNHSDLRCSGQQVIKPILG